MVMKRAVNRAITLLFFAIFALVFIAQRRLLNRYNKDLKAIRTADDKVVTSALMGNLRHMSAIALPKWTTREGLTSLGFVLLFLIRSILYVMGSHADGKIMEMILATAQGRANGKQRLVSAVSFFAGVKLMQAATAGVIEHVRHHLIASYRKILTHHFHEKFFNKLTYYHATAIDSRLEAADTVIPIYCGEFAEHFAELPYYFVMPFFDATVSLLEVIRQVGSRPAVGLLGVAGIFLAALKALTPPFGRIHALLLHREEEFKKKHTDVQSSVEQIALMNGGDVSRLRANHSFGILMRSLEQMAAAKGSFQLLEDAVGGCLWELVGFLVSWSVVQSRAGGTSGGSRGGGGGRRRDREAKDKLLSSMVVQRRLVTDFHVAITAMVVNIREVSHLSEFTEKLAEFDRTLDSIARGEFARFVGTSSATVPNTQTIGGGGATGGDDGTIPNGIVSGTTDGGEVLAADASTVVMMETSQMAASVSLSPHRNSMEDSQEQKRGGGGPTTAHFRCIATNNNSHDMLPTSDSVIDFSSAAATAHASVGDEAQQQLREDAKVAQSWGIEELGEDGWVPCVMSPALHHATYTSTVEGGGKATPKSRSSSASAVSSSSPEATPTTGASVGESTAANFVIVKHENRTDEDEEEGEKEAGGEYSTAGATQQRNPESSNATASSQEFVCMRLRHPFVTFTDVDVSTPNGKVLIRNLNLTWLQGQRWAISGPNGCGKSSLLRVIARTWLPSRGRVGIHDRVRFIYLPQTPYFPPDATLAEQVVYPDSPHLVRFLVVDKVRFSSASACEEVSTEKKRQKRKTPTYIVRKAVAVGNTSVDVDEDGNPFTAMTAPTDCRDLMVCPIQQRRMKEALQLATGRQLLSEVIHGWNSPTAGLYNPHRRYSRSGGGSPLSSAKSKQDAKKENKENKKEKEENKKPRAGGDASESSSDADVGTDDGQTASGKDNKSCDGAVSSPAGSISSCSPLASPSATTQAGEGAATKKGSGGDALFSSPSPVTSPPSDALSPLVGSEEEEHKKESEDLDSAAKSALLAHPTHLGPFSGCDRSLSWPSLSGGQQQKLSLSRAFYHSLKAIEEGYVPVVVLDESTSQMDEASEDTVFRHLAERGIDMLSVSHRKEVVLRHTHILQLSRDPSEWRVVEVDENTIHEALEI